MGVFVFARFEISDYHQTVTHEPLKLSHFSELVLCSVLCYCNLKHLFRFIGGSLGSSLLFTHFLEHLFSSIMGRFEEPKKGLPILGSQYLVNYSFWVI